MANPEYQRLTRARSRGEFAVAVSSRSSLWLGIDHVLAVESNGYTENYKRFYFRDVQALVLQRTSRATVWNLVCSILFVLVTTPALVTHVLGLKIFLFILSGLFAFILAANSLRGPTCRCFLRTAVQTEPLPSLSRVRRAQKVFARLRPLITAAQGGELTPQMVSERLREQISAPAMATASVADDPNLPPRLES